MNKWLKKNISYFFVTILLTSCATGVPEKHITTNDWNEATHQVLVQYSSTADHGLQPYFSKAKVNYPPQKIALITFKKEKEMELWAKDQNHNNWQYVRTYPLTAFSGKPGPKLKYHDGQIPEGVYNIVMLNPFSSWQLSMLINYPNEFDKMHAEEDGRDNLGGDIYIHGKDLSVGCLAIGDEAIDELFVLTARVGAQNTKVIIAPNDMRIKKPVTNLKYQPAWVSELYKDLKQELQAFDPMLDHAIESPEKTASHDIPLPSLETMPISPTSPANTYMVNLPISQILPIKF